MICPYWYNRGVVVLMTLKGGKLFVPGIIFEVTLHIKTQQNVP